MANQQNTLVEVSSQSCDRSQDHPRRLLKGSSVLFRGVGISIVLLFLCHTNLNDVIPILSYPYPFAEAWVSSPCYYASTTTRRHNIVATPTKKSLTLDKHRQSKVTRWYVHDDDTKIDEVEVKVIPSPTTSTKINNNNDRNINNNNEEQNSNQVIHSNPKKKLDLKILLIDNHDSYTYNLYQYISTMTIHPVQVVMNDAFSSYDEFITSLNDSSTSTSTTSKTADDDDMLSLSDHFDCIILSPGPGQPSHPTDMGIVLETIRHNAQVPILGVCLGHQALGYVYGNEVKLSPCGPVHGLMSEVVYDDEVVETNEEQWRREEREEERLTCELFRDIPQNFEVVRYHSLVVDFPNDDENKSAGMIEPIAWCNSLKETDSSSSSSVARQTTLQHESNTNICMALRHKEYPHYGVQFHPESVGTGEAGYTLLRNFCDFSHEYKDVKEGRVELKAASIATGTSLEEVVTNGDGVIANESKLTNDDVPTENINPTTPSKYRVVIHKLDSKDEHASPLPLPKQVFEALYSTRPNSFWLDSSTGESKFNTDDNDDMPGNVGDDDEGCPIASNSRFSIMGSNDGPLSRKIEYFGREHDLERRGLRVTTASSGEVESMIDTDILSYLRQKLVAEREIVERSDMVTFDDVSLNGKDAANTGYTLRTMDEFGESLPTAVAAGDQLPFDYRGGYVGYLGYEVRHETQCRIFEQEGGFGCDAANVPDDSTLLNGHEGPSSGKTNSNVPTAAFLFADRSLLYDHESDNWYIIGVTENNRGSADVGAGCQADGSVEDTLSWIQSIKSRIVSMGENKITDKSTISTDKANCEADYDDVVFFANRSKAQYQMDISRSHEEIRNGESYELCVTNQLEAEITLPKHSTKARHESPFELYKLLRKENPAPFSAFMNLYEEDGPKSEISSSALSICCSSPERFISVKKAQMSPHDNQVTSLDKPLLPKRQFVVESKPIKGTAARYTGAGSNGVEESPELVKRVDSQIAANLRESVKDRAENLMIVDLLRNDLGRVCRVGSVHVPKLMHIESYATVHQMVSTIRGTLDGDIATKNVIDVIEACFPGGSMTGAPKQRTMEILEEIEEGVSRGPYSGCLGYISLNGCMDMNIVIRSAILTQSKKDHSDEEETTMETWKASIGCGGAITALSNSDDEYEEMLLKSRVVRRTISDWVAQTAAERTQHLQCTDDVVVR